MPFLIRSYRGFPVQCAVTNNSGGTFALVQEIQAEPQVEPQQAEGSVSVASKT